MQPEDDLDTPRYRSSAAARLAHMPVNTLRIWERRHAVVAPSKSPSGQRLYSARDVHRLALIKQLVAEGHAISLLAPLEQAQLERLASSAPLPRPRPEAAGSLGSPVVVGRALGQRLAAEGVAVDPKRLFDDLASALAAAPVARGEPLLLHLSTLHPELAQQVLLLADRCDALCVAVVYTFGSSTAIHSLRMAGVRLHHATVNSLEVTAMLDETGSHRVASANTDGGGWGRRSPRYSDEALARIGRRSSTLACECPRHVAELILQLSGFEQYSDACASRSAADAALHRYLGDVASRARSLFETALERMAQEEGWQDELPVVAASALPRGASS